MESFFSAAVQEAFLQGLCTTVWLSSLSGILALLLGLLGAFCKLFGPKWLKGVAGLYVEGFRNTPLLIQLYLFYRGLQSMGVTLSPEACGVLALSLYTGAYLTEIFRAAVQAIPQQQTDAALALGLNTLQTYGLVLLPQAIRWALPPIGNQLISLTKNSSLLAFITVSDLFLVIYKGAVDEFKPVPYFIEGALLYMALTLTLSTGIHGVERWLFSPKHPTTNPKAARLEVQP
ncbi:MAG: amino acid ABC transporter permease [Candidatus Melainabacteria bacterium]|nr:amino acid ABC transporter permease [Candidatus Melainabacteria bacterium]